MGYLPCSSDYEIKPDITDSSVDKAVRIAFYFYCTWNYCSMSLSLAIFMYLWQSHVKYDD